MLSINFNTSKTDIYLCRLRTATALNLCEIQVIQINHDSIWEIFLVVQKMVYHILGVKVKNIYIFPGEKSDRIFLRHSQLHKIGLTKSIQHFKPDLCSKLWWLRTQSRFDISEIFKNLDDRTIEDLLSFVSSLIFKFSCFQSILIWFYLIFQLW